MQLKNSAPIGVFDSGVGGLTVVREILRQLPQESLLYYADTAHVPYGPRDPQQLRGFARNITAFLVNQGCKMIIVACNTSTSLVYDELQAKYLPLPMVGVIQPGVDRALEMSKNKKIGVIGTQATITSGVYQKLLHGKDPDADITAVFCPRFVPFVEAGQTDGTEVEEAAAEYLQPILGAGADTLILGCTHYPFLMSVLERITGPGVTIIDPARETVTRAKNILLEKGLERKEGIPTYRYYASGDPERFRLMGSKFLQKEIGQVQGVCLD